MLKGSPATGSIEAQVATTKRKKGLNDPLAVKPLR